MSAFGGDSWAREAQYRKRRVDDLMLSSSSSSSSLSSSSSNYKKLSNGKYACVICPHNPILDSPLAFSIHAKGSRHGDAFSRLKERDLSRLEELNKRIALSSDSVTTSSSTTVQVTRTKVCNQPLIEQTRKAIFEAQCNRSWDQIAKVGSSAQTVNTLSFPCDSKILRSPHLVIEPPTETRFEEPPKTKERRSVVVTEAASKILVDWNDELRKQREKELKFIAAGWKRDGFGKWYKDENVEFDSDEEDPNDSLN